MFGRQLKQHLGVTSDEAIESDDLREATIESDDLREAALCHERASPFKSSTNANSGDSGFDPQGLQQMETDCAGAGRWPGQRQKGSFDEGFSLWSWNNGGGKVKGKGPTTTTVRWLSQVREHESLGTRVPKEE